LSSKYLVILSALVGIISGVGAFAFYILLELCTELFLGELGGLTPPRAGGEPAIIDLNFHSGMLPLYLIPAIGGVLSGLIVYKFAPEAEGHGTDAVIKAFHRMRGEIRGRVPVVKMLASSITIGSGGSAGREGPIIQIGAGFGSFIASLLRLSDKDRRMLVICGMAGGVGSIFRSPFGGGMFAIEVLYRRDTEVEGIVPAFVSSIVAFMTFNTIMGHITGTPFGIHPIFEIPPVSIHSPFEFIPYTLVGLVSAAVGLLYIKTFYTIHRLFKKFRTSPYIKPVIGGLLTGVIGFFLPGVLGMGYGYVQMAINGRLAIYIIVAIIFGKIISTSFTIGSGGSGGVFAPSIVIGSMVGALVGYLFNFFFPEIVVQPEAYVLIGMAAFVAAVAKTPIAGILMVLEMTGGYYLLPALMLSSTIAYYISGDTSIYAEQVATRVESPAHRREMSVDVLENVRVAEAMVPAERVMTVSPDNTIFEVLDLIEKTGHQGFPVLNDGKLVGMITFEDVERVPIEKRKETKVSEIMTRELVVTYPDETLEDALIKLTERDVGRLPVVRRDDERHMVGLITRSDIMKAHAREVARLFR
jgi:CIC family chloride channel protein